MSLLTESRAAQTHAGLACGVSLLPAALIAEVEEALDEPGIYATTIAAILKTRGLVVSDETLRRHKKRLCQCR
jgi:hypothetical protein